MKTLDRYVLLTFLKNYLVAFAVLVGMYVTIDAVYNIDELFVPRNRPQDISALQLFLNSLANVADFYAYQSVLIFTQLAPVIPVVAAAFTLMRMTRFNELVATLAAGISLVRVAAPILLATVVLTFGVFAVQELVIPEIVPKLLRDHREAGSDASRAFPIPALEDDQGNILVAARFDPPTLTAPAVLRELDLVLRDKQARPVAHVRAELARWDPPANKWQLTNGVLSTGLLPEDIRTPERPALDLPTSLTPDDILLNRSRDFVDLLSTRRLDQLLASPRSRDLTDLQRVKHFRFTQHINNILLLMLALPCIMTREPRSLKQGGVYLLAAMGSYLGMIFVCQHLAGSPAPAPALATHWPALMAWLPPLVFAPLALLALDRIKT